MSDDPQDDQASRDDGDNSILGDSPDSVDEENQTMDIDKTLNEVGLEGDDKGPHALNSEDILKRADDDQF